MSKEEPEIRIPDAPGSFGPTPVEKLEKKTEEKFRNIDTLIYTVVIAVIITAIIAVITVGAIVIDQLHFNNQTYREFSDFKKDNTALMKRIDEIENKLDGLNQIIINDQQEPNK